MCCTWQVAANGHHTMPLCDGRGCCRFSRTSGVSPVKERHSPQIQQSAWADRFATSLKSTRMAHSRCVRADSAIPWGHSGYLGSRTQQERDTFSSNCRAEVLAVASVSATQSYSCDPVWDLSLVSSLLLQPMLSLAIIAFSQVLLYVVGSKKFEQSLSRKFKLKLNLELSETGRG